MCIWRDTTRVDPPGETPRERATAPAEGHVVHLEHFTSELVGTDDILSTRPHLVGAGERADLPGTARVRPPGHLVHRRPVDEPGVGPLP
jgi:hypothetical protein